MNRRPADDRPAADVPENGSVESGSVENGDRPEPAGAASAAGEQVRHQQKDIDPEDWAASSGSKDEWLLRERPPHW
jgi:hypothetical protein